MKFRFFTVIILLSFLLLSFSTDQPLKTTYISNEGFMLETGGKKILIDALFGHLDADWCDVPNADMVSNMENANPPFDDVDLILVTHGHRDHFTAEIAANHLVNNKKGVLVCTPQTHRLLKKQEKYPEIRDQVVEVLPDRGEFVTKEFNGITVKIMRFNHSTYMVTDPETGKQVNRHENVENLGYLITFNGRTFFHNGDARFNDETEYLQYSLDKENIDVAFVHADPTNTIVKDILTPDHVVMMHVAPDNNAQLRDWLKENSITNTTVFEKAMDSKTF